MQQQAAERFRAVMRKRIAEGGQTLTRVHNGVKSTFCGRVAQIDMSAWSFAPVDQGVTTGRRPYLICDYQTELASGDIIVRAGGTAWQCDEVSYPERFGYRTHCQAVLREVDYGE
jgi:hypothetical protein